MLIILHQACWKVHTCVQGLCETFVDFFFHFHVSLPAFVYLITCLKTRSGIWNTWAGFSRSKYPGNLNLQSLMHSFSSNRKDVFFFFAADEFPDYKRVAPAHSFINAADFESAADLADYLKFLDRNDEEFLSYFWWRSSNDTWTEVWTRLDKPML